MTEPSSRVRYNSLRKVAASKFEIDAELLGGLVKELRALRAEMWASEIESMRQRLLRMKAELAGARGAAS